MLANHFGELGMSRDEVMTEASRREGHPDNVAACVLGGLTASAMSAGKVTAVSFGAELPWRLVLALPPASLATSAARALLPDHYSRADAVANVQATALLVAAFALGRRDLLLAGTQDRMHQPYRAAACPLLDRLLPLAGTNGIVSVTLSGAGPSVLLLLEENAKIYTVQGAAGEGVELVETRIGRGSELQMEW
jgi:homoserine kinase